MSNLLNHTILASAAATGIAAADMARREAACVVDMNQAFARFKEANPAATPEETVAYCEGNLANLLAGRFLGLSEAAGDATFNRAASEGVMSQVFRIALLQASGPTASAKDKKAARAALNLEQIERWDGMRGQTSRILKASMVPHPHPRAVKASTENEAETPETTPETVAPAKVVFSPDNVALPTVNAPAETLAAFLELGAFVAQTYNKAIEGNGVEGDLGSLLIQFATAVGQATTKLRKGAEKLELAANVAAKAAESK